MNLPSFEDFFHEVHDYSPFPWQIRLVERVKKEGWPSLLDLPTGIGKTSAIDVALYTLACCPERSPRRIAFIVDRRIIVDQGNDHVQRILKRMEVRDGAAWEVAIALKKLFNGGDSDEPFTISVLRGGIPREDDWVKRPNQSAVVLSTVDQLGSRFFFRGYGVNPRMAPIHAGLLGNDTLLLLDEVHLAQPFLKTLRAVGKRWRREKEVELPDRFAVVAMSATPGKSEIESTFTLNQEDYDHPIIQQRLKAEKLTKLQLVTVPADASEKSKLAILASKAAAAAGRELLKEGAHVIAVVVNRVETARLVWKALGSVVQEEKFQLQLLTGRMRPLERERMLDEDILPRVKAGAKPESMQLPLIVVATQCIEAGPDFDFDGLVTECASLDALRQRFGRLDRRGERTKSGLPVQGVILARSDLISSRSDDPVYGNTIAGTWGFLNSLSSNKEKKKNTGVINFGVEAMNAFLETTNYDREKLSPPIKRAPVLLPSHLDAWVQTSPLSVPDPEVGLWLHGPDKVANEVSVVWRRGIPSDLKLQSRVENEMTPQEKVLHGYLSQCRPLSSEAVSLPVRAVKNWLLKREESSSISDVVFEKAEGAETLESRVDRGEITSVIQWLGDEVRLKRVQDIRPGETIVIPSIQGGIDPKHLNWDPHSKEPVIDLAEEAHFKAGHRTFLRLDSEHLKDLSLDTTICEKVESLLANDKEQNENEARLSLKRWIEALPETLSSRSLSKESSSDDNHTERNTSHFSRVISQNAWRAILKSIKEEPLRFSYSRGIPLIIHERKRRKRLSLEASTESEEGSFIDQNITIKSHCERVKTIVGEWLRTLGFAKAFISDLELAAQFHDIGKADPRFQRWLVGGSEVRASAILEPLAKSEKLLNAKALSKARQLSGYPKGERHELHSLALVKTNENAIASMHDADLVLHLVGSHHGWCRPFSPPFDDSREVLIEYEDNGQLFRASSRHRMARLDSGCSERFWNLTQKYGWWGLAWLEALLRLADHEASREEV